MVRKGNQHKNSFERKTAKCKQTLQETTDACLPGQEEKVKGPRQTTADREQSGSGYPGTGDQVNETNYMTCGKKNKQKHQSVCCNEKSDVSVATESLSNVQTASEDDILFDVTEQGGGDGILPGGNHNPSLNMLRGMTMENMASHFWSSIVLAGQRLELVVMGMFNACSGWVEQQKPGLSTFKAYMCKGRDYILVQIKHVYPFIWTWIFHLGKLIFLLSVVWLDCNARGFSSLLRLGTTSFFTVVWCIILSMVSMVGFTKAFIVMVISAMVGAFIGLGLGVLILAIFATISLWLYGSFWMTSLIIFIGGSTFALRQERVALLLTTIYSVYCAKSYVGWFGLLLGLNMSFLSSDILTYFAKNNINEQRSYYSAERDGQTPSGSGHFYGETSHSSPNDDACASRRSGATSTSGCDEELTSEGEVLRLLNCNDHYSAFGFTLFENIDVSLLKREYRRKAMLVHPDKNMGNEKAAEAFKKLQNAYEVLLDTLKRKTYDDELRRKELLNFFRRFQTASQKNGKNNIFKSGSPHFEADGEGSHEESRRITCNKCGDFHLWTRTERSKSQARWCQACNDFHQAKDGDGWLEQSLHPFLFGLLHTVDAPRAYVSADGRIYDATEWFICQGMRCPANTHKPSFHVNTSLSSKHNPSTKGASSSSHKASGTMPNASNTEEMMSEEEFLEWLQNAMQSGAFEPNGGSSNESSKGATGVKKKRKGKKQR